MTTGVSDNGSKQVWVPATGVTFSEPSGQQGDFYFKAESRAESVYLSPPTSKSVSAEQNEKLTSKNLSVYYIMGSACQREGFLLSSVKWTEPDFPGSQLWQMIRCML